MSRSRARILSVITAVLMILSTVFSYPVSVASASENTDANKLIRQRQTETINKAVKDNNKYTGQAKYSKEIFNDNNAKGNKEITGDPEETVRIIVQLDEKSVKDYAGTRPLAAASNDKLLVNKVTAVQKNYKDKILKIDRSAAFRRSYSVLINGFSFDGKRKDIEALKKMPGVKSASEANIYYPDMNYSKSLTNVEKVWQDYGYKGEGLVVSIIDTGIDYTHKDMRITDESKVKIKESNPAGPGKYFNIKVPYGYNFADNNTDVIDRTGSMHGMHVAGIVAANGTDQEVKENKAIKGAAPEAQLLAMKVFSNNPTDTGAFSDDIVAAIEDSVKHDADVINMSLGASASFQDPEDPEQEAVRNANESGVVVVISAGNSEYSTAPYKFSNVPDTGLTGAPGLAHESLMVASYENSTMTTTAIEYTFKDGSGSAAYTMSQADPVVKLPNKDGYQIIDCGLGTVEDFAGKDVKGKIALIMRGSLDFVTKQLNAQEAGAIGVIVYNHASGGDELINMATDPSITIPAVFVGYTDGMKLKSLIDSDLKVKFQGKITSVPNSLSGDMSSFSSWGPAQNLDFKPQITAPGGNIWSTVNDNKYENMSGTSMSSPHMSGIMALIIQHMNTSFKDVQGVDKAELAKTLAVNTAKVMIDPLNGGSTPFSPRRQGAGMADAKAAVENYVSATYNDEPVAALKQITSDTKAFTLKLHNYSDKSVSYKVTDLSGVLTEQSRTIDTMSYDVKLAGASISFDKTDVTVPAGSDAYVNVKITFGASTPENVFAEGFIKFESKTTGSPSLGVPYMGFYGQWDEPEILDKPMWDKDSIFGSTALLTEDGGEYYYLGFEGIDENDMPIINPDKIAINPITNVLPMLTFLRNSKNCITEILNSNNEVVRTISMDGGVRKNLVADGVVNIMNSRTWDGKLYNPLKGMLENAPDGQYYVQVRNVIDYPGAKYQMLKMPVKIDSVAPGVSDVKIDKSTGRTMLKFKAQDGLSGISQFGFFIDYSAELYENTFFQIQPDKDGYYSLELNLPASKSYTIEIVPFDNAGNYAFYEFSDMEVKNIDITQPEVSDNGVAYVYSPDFTLKFDITKTLLDKADRIAILMDGDTTNPLAILNKTAVEYKVTGFTPGTHTLVVVPIDSAGNILDMDEIKVAYQLEKLSVVINNLSSGTMVNKKLIYIEGTALKKPDELKINGKNVAVNDDLTFSTEVELVEGANKVNVYAKINAANGKPEEVYEYAINVYCDTTPPELTLENEDEIIYVGNDVGTYKVKGTVKDNLYGYKLYANGSQILTVDSSGSDPEKTFREYESDVKLINKVNKIEIKAEDAAGNITAKYLEVRRSDSNFLAAGVEFDTTFPVDGSAYSSKRLVISGKVLKAIDYFRINGKDVAINSTTGYFSEVVNIADGKNTITIEAKASDSENPVVKQINIYADFTAPLITLTNPVDAGYYTYVTLPNGVRTYTIEGKVSDNNNGYKIYIDNVEVLASDNKEEKAFSKEVAIDSRITKVEIKVEDSNGNAAYKYVEITSSDKMYEYGVEFNNLPSQGQAFNSNKITLTGKVDVRPETFRINGTDVSVNGDLTFSRTVSLKEGENKIEIQVKQAGLEEYKSSVDVICDMTAPVIALNNTDETIYVKNGTESYKLEGKISDNLLGYTLYANSNEVMTSLNKEEKTFSCDIELNEKSTEVTLKTVDEIGNECVKKVTIVVLDNLDVIFDNLFFNTDNAVLTGKLSEKAKKLTINGVETAVNSDLTFSTSLKLKNGKNTVSYEAAGYNNETVKGTVTVTLEKKAPIVVIDNVDTSKGTGVIYVGSNVGKYTLKGKVTEGLDYVVNIDGQVVDTEDNAFEKEVELNTNTKTIEISVTDAAGNETTKTIVFIKEQAKEINISISKPSYNKKTERIEYTGKKNKDGNIVVSVSGTIENAAKGPVEVTINGVRQKDVNNRSTKCSFSGTVVVDKFDFHDISVEVKDSQGNMQEEVISAAILEKSKPSIELVYPKSTSATTPNETYDVVFKASDETEGTAVYVNDNEVTEVDGLYTQSIQIPDTRTGVSVKIKAVDKWGNETVKTLKIKRSSDTKAPQVLLVTPAKTTDKDEKVVVKVMDYEQSDIKSVKINGVEQIIESGVYETLVEITPVYDIRGKFTFTVAAEDASGRIVTKTFTVYYTAPKK